mmetsp:Transcript_8448/g.12896  ORF Transcript_8448/g.12896 Transcript_8448/m.12896 type:complete len:91 (+) Transcript_8448:2026-2298(+)
MIVQNPEKMEIVKIEEEGSNELSTIRRKTASMVKMMTLKKKKTEGISQPLLDKKDKKHKKNPNIAVSEIDDEKLEFIHRDVALSSVNATA